MGNRATVIFWNGEHEPTKQVFSPAVYLHWNGGPESVYSFLEELDRRDVRADQDYECARFVQIVGEFFDHGESQGGLSLGIANGPATIYDFERVQTDHGDNGLFLVYRGSDAATLANTPDYRGELHGAADAGIGWVRRWTERNYDASDHYGGSEVYKEGYGCDSRYVLCEWKPEAVAQELEEAGRDDYREGIRSAFREIAGERVARS